MIAADERSGVIGAEDCFVISRRYSVDACQMLARLERRLILPPPSARKIFQSSHTRESCSLGHLRLRDGMQLQAHRSRRQILSRLLTPADQTVAPWLPNRSVLASWASQGGKGQ